MGSPTLFQKSPLAQRSTVAVLRSRLATRRIISELYLCRRRGRHALNSGLTVSRTRTSSFIEYFLAN
jgi:hypothetical protein